MNPWGLGLDAGSSVGSASVLNLLSCVSSSQLCSLQGLTGAWQGVNRAALGSNIFYEAVLRQISCILSSESENYWFCSLEDYQDPSIFLSLSHAGDGSREVYSSHLHHLWGKMEGPLPVTVNPCAH